MYLYNIYSNADIQYIYSNVDIQYIFKCRYTIYTYSNVLRVFIWLQRVLVAACGIFRWGLQALHRGGWDLAAWPGVEPRRPALWMQGLSHRVARGAPARCLFHPLRPSGEEARAVLLGDENHLERRQAVQAEDSYTVQWDSQQTLEGCHPASSSLACWLQTLKTAYLDRIWSRKKKWLGTCESKGFWESLYLSLNSAVNLELL